MINWRFIGVPKNLSPGQYSHKIDKIEEQDGEFFGRGIYQGRISSMRLTSFTVEGPNGSVIIQAPPTILKAHSMNSNLACSACGDMDGCHMPAKFGKEGDCIAIIYLYNKRDLVHPSEDLGVIAKTICMKIGHDHQDDPAAIEALLETLRKTCIK